MPQQGFVGNDLPDHRRLCWIECRIGYAAPNPTPKRDDDKWLRKVVSIPRTQVTKTYPTTIEEQDAILVEMFQAVIRQLRRQPLSTVRRGE